MLGYIMNAVARLGIANLLLIFTAQHLQATKLQGHGDPLVYQCSFKVIRPVADNCLREATVLSQIRIIQGVVTNPGG